MHTVIRSLIISSPILVYGRVIGSSIRTREIRGFALPGLVVFGERNNLSRISVAQSLKIRTVEKGMQGGRTNKVVVCDSDLSIFPKKGDSRIFRFYI
jgi:hypothetical protein